MQDVVVPFVGEQAPGLIKYVSVRVSPEVTHTHTHVCTLVRVHSPTPTRDRVRTTRGEHQRGEWTGGQTLRGLGTGIHGVHGVPSPVPLTRYDTTHSGPQSHTRPSSYPCVSVHPTDGTTEILSVKKIVDRQY